MNKKLLLAVLIGILIIPASAFAIFDDLEFHKNFHPDMKGTNGYGIYKIDTFWLGNDILDVELMENTDICYIDCYAEVRLRRYAKIGGSSNDYDVKFKNTLTNSMKFEDFGVAVERPFIEYYKQEECIKYTLISGFNKTKPEQTKEICVETAVLLKNHTYNKYIDIDFKELPDLLNSVPINEDVYIKITGTKKPEQNIDWRLNILGYELNQWAWWNTSYTNRTNITQRTENYDFAVYINGSAGFKGQMILFNPSQGSGIPAIYSNGSAPFIVANDTAELNYESKEYNNNPTSIYDDDLMGAWNFDKGLNDSSSNAFHGTETGSLTNVSGLFGDAIQINAIAEWVNIADESLVNVFQNDFTISIWIKPNWTTDVDYGAIASFCDNCYNIMATRTTRKIIFYDAGDWAWDTESSVIPDDGNWHHLVWTADSVTGKRFYLDGVLDINKTADNNNCGGRDDASRIGGRCDDDNSESYQGHIDAVRIYNRSVSTKEVEILFNQSLSLNNTLAAMESEVGGGAGGSWIDGDLNNVTQSYYKDSELLPDVWVNSTHDYNYSFVIIKNSTGWNKTINSGSELAGVIFTNNSITIDTTLYSDDEYYFNLSGFNTQADTMINLSLGFVIDNTDPTIAIFDPTTSVFTTTFPYNFLLNYSIVETNNDICWFNSTLAASGLKYLYEEDADVYSCDIMHNWNFYDFPCNLTYDGVWNTYARDQNDVNGTSYVYMNYSKPYFANSSSLWEVKHGWGAVHKNISFEDFIGCWNQEPLQLRGHSSYKGALTNSSFDCWNGSAWENVSTAVAGSEEWRVYEEAIHWRTTNNLNCSGSLRNLSASTFGNYKITVFANDSAGNEHSNFTTFSIDYANVSIDGITCGFTYNTIVKPNLTAYSTNNASSELLLNDESIYNFSSFIGAFSNTSVIINLSGRDDGDYNLTFIVTDNESNTVNTTSCVFYVDTHAPTINFDWLISNGWYNDLNHSVNFSVVDSVDANITCNITYNNESWNQDFTNNTVYQLDALLHNGTNYLNATCFDGGNNNDTIIENFVVDYVQINVRDEETRLNFNLTNYDAIMMVSLNSSREVTYDNTNESQMLNWYFYVINDTIRQVNLAIETVYYRSQTNLQNIRNITFFMYNASEHSSSQIIFEIQTISYDKPLVIKRPRSTGEDLITAEYSTGDDLEVNAYLIDSRLYNVYGYDDDDVLRFITEIMVSGARTIPITISFSDDYTFTSHGSNRGTFYAEPLVNDENNTNYTLTAIGSGGAFRISIYDNNSNVVAAGVYTGTGTLTYVINKSKLDDTNFYANFSFSDRTIMRTTTLGSPAIVYPDLAFWKIDEDNTEIAIILLLISFGIAGMFAKYSMSLGLFIGGGFLAVVNWASDFSFMATQLLNITAMLFVTIGGIVLFLAYIERNN